MELRYIHKKKKKKRKKVARYFRRLPRDHARAVNVTKERATRSPIPLRQRGDLGGDL